MKIAVLCLCLFTIALAVPFRKSKFHDGSVSSEEKHQFRGHHAHKHHHQHHHSHSHSQEHSSEHVNSHESQERHSSSRLSPDSEESEEITEQQTLLVPSGKSKEDDLSHSEMDDHDDGDHDDVDDDSHSESDDSDESDDSHQVITEVPTDGPFTPSAAPDPFTGRGDSPYGIQGGQLMFLRKSGKSSEKFDSHDTTQEDDSRPDVDSHESKAVSSESQETSIEREDKSNLRDSHEVHSASHHKSLEHDSRQKFDSVEEDHDNSKADISQESYGIDHSSKQLKAHRGKSQEVDHDHDVDNVSNQSVDDHHSVEDNEIKY